MTNEELQRKMIRHGELLFIAVDALPDNIEQIFEGETYTVGHSETGHNHIAVSAIPKAITVFKPVGADSNDIYLKVSGATRVEHQKTFDRHETLDLLEGMYLVRPKNEYDPFAKLVKRVQD